MKKLKMITLSITILFTVAIFAVGCGKDEPESLQVPIIDVIGESIENTENQVKFRDEETGNLMCPIEAGYIIVPESNFYFDIDGITYSPVYYDPMTCSSLFVIREDYNRVFFSLWSEDLFNPPSLEFFTANSRFTATMPDLIGLNQNDVISRITNFRNETQFFSFEWDYGEVESDVEVGLVAETEPAYGELLRPGDIIILRLSIGISPELVLEPIVINFEVTGEVFMAYWDDFVDEVEKMFSQYDVSRDHYEELANIGAKWLFPLLIEMETPDLQVFAGGRTEIGPNLHARLMQTIVDPHLSNLPENITEDDKQEYVDNTIKLHWIQLNVQNAIQEADDVRGFLFSVIESLRHELLSDVQY